MYSVQKNGNIVQPRGDTMLLKVTLYGGSFPEDTVAVFGICTKRDGKNVFSKVFPVENGAVAIYLTNPETRRLAVGEYRWDLRVVTNPEYDSYGTVHCDDDSDNVLSIFSGAGMPTFEVTEVAVNV